MGFREWLYGPQLKVGQYCRQCGCVLILEWYNKSPASFDPNTGNGFRLQKQRIRCTNERWYWHPTTETGNKRVAEVSSNCKPSQPILPPPDPDLL